jgi:hypothetical protein
MPTLEHPVRASRKAPRTLARSRKPGRMENPDAAARKPSDEQQQTTAEPTARAAGDWPPNTWWP